jgi:hypothetical protein
MVNVAAILAQSKLGTGRACGVMDGYQRTMENECASPAFIVNALMASAQRLA